MMILIVYDKFSVCSSIDLILFNDKFSQILWYVGYDDE